VLVAIVSSHVSNASARKVDHVRVLHRRRKAAALMVEPRRRGGGGIVGNGGRWRWELGLDLFSQMMLRHDLYVSLSAREFLNEPRDGFFLRLSATLHLRQLGEQNVVHALQVSHVLFNGRRHRSIR